ncbi:DUF4113 domain-containing protein [Shewanella holmiensis]|uniref:DUF4113 domain-containing protein n=1 Tax=Shewanella holmiensis TaxID=2952222 RepID=UPI003CC91F38
MFSGSTSSLKLIRTYDDINQHFGTNALFLAPQGTEQKWSMRRNLQTKHYTAKWDCVPQIRC